MGEEWGCDQPFYFFCDFPGDLNHAVREGRRREFAKFPQFADPSARERIPDPTAIDTFAACVLDWENLRQAPYRDWLALCRTLLETRHREIVPRLGDAVRLAEEPQAIGGEALLIRWRMGDASTLSLLCALSDRPSRIVLPAGEPAGLLLHATSPIPEPHDGRCELPPWFVAWHLAAS
jgi:1,4-alpha-glucan branching enzyme